MTKEYDFSVDMPRRPSIKVKPLGDVRFNHQMRQIERRDKRNTNRHVDGYHAEMPVHTCPECPPFLEMVVKEVYKNKKTLVKGGNI